jgi:glycerophosphoryl diester phosphodiesterase
MRAKPVQDAMQAWNIAHRGGAGIKPENTLAAFADARMRGCDGAELDVQLSRDGVAVVHHDFRLMQDVARKDGAWLDVPGPRIKDLTLWELQQFDIGRPRPGSAYAARHVDLQAVDGAVVPTLAQVVALVRPGFTLMVELKCDLSDDSADPIALADAAFAVAGQGVIYVGFDWRALLRIRELGGSCWFTTDKLQGDAGPVIETIASAGGQGWFTNFRDATPDAVAYARSRGLKVGAWTVNDPADLSRLDGLDALCTDRPDLLARLD